MLSGTPTANTPLNVSPSHRPAPLHATIALFAAASILGCNSNPSASSPSASAVSTPAARQPVTPVPAVKKHLYSAEADPKVEIASALKQADRENKHVILDFGGDWCGDCQVLDIYFHQQPNLALLQKNFVLVHVWVPETLDKNGDIGLKYGVPITKGVPALAVLDENGKVLYAQRTGQFNDMRHMDAGSVSEFLNRWKG
jgi:thiol:disulfide interchange protein